MSWLASSVPARARRRGIALVLLMCAVGGAPSAARAEGDVVGLGTDVAAPAAVKAAPPAQEAAGTGTPEQPMAADPDAFGMTAAGAPLSGTVTELRALRARTVARVAALRARLLGLEAASESAETAADDALGRYTDHMVALFDGAQTPRIEALIAVRKEADPVTRDALTAALDPADLPVARGYLAAMDRAVAATAALQQVQEELDAVDTRVESIDLAIADRTHSATPASEVRYSVDTDLVFATGPIPGIGYWGKAAGGGFLAGWGTMATAAVGGVGCTSPVPSLQATGQVERGDASWYGPGFHGQSTANGEVYDQEAMTAAHKTLPFGTIVRVYDTATARCAFVRINDRGPFVDGRIIDLSHGAAVAVGMEGAHPVEIEVWANPGSAPIP